MKNNIIALFAFILQLSAFIFNWLLSRKQIDIFIKGLKECENELYAKINESFLEISSYYSEELNKVITLMIRDFKIAGNDESELNIDSISEDPYQIGCFKMNSKEIYNDIKDISSFIHRINVAITIHKILKWIVVLLIIFLIVLVTLPYLFETIIIATWVYKTIAGISIVLIIFHLLNYTKNDNLADKIKDRYEI